MSSDIFKINKDLITKAQDLYYFGNDVIKHNSPYGYLISSGRFRVPKVIFGELPGKELGHYDPSQHLIAIDISLTPDSREDDRENVFMHELAHAVDTVLNGSSAHDGTFKAVCKNLNVKENFSKAKVSLGDKTKIKNKIDKLIALSSSDFENEACLALNKAKELMLSSGLSYLYSDDEDQLYGCVLECSGRLPGYKKDLISFICRITGAFHFLDAYNHNKTIKVFGSVEQVETTMYIYNDLMFKIDQECKKLRAQWHNPWSRFSSSQTKEGIVHGIISKNSDIERSVKGTALEVSSVKIKKIYERLHNMKFRTVTHRVSISSQVMLGMSCGKNINISMNKNGITKRLGYAG